MVVDISDDILTSFLFTCSVACVCLTVAVVALLATDGGKD